MEAAATLVLSNDSLNTAGILLLAVVAIEYGGTFVLRIVRGSEPATGFQQAFFRAGHAHAGVLVILSLVALILADAGRGVTRPSRLIVLLYAGTLSLAAGVVSLGIGLLTA